MNRLAATWRTARHTQTAAWRTAQEAKTTAWRTTRKAEAVAWRALQKADTDAWRNVSDSPPFRLIRWLGVLGLVIGFWGANGNPRSATAWLPVLAVGVLLLLPDAASISVGGLTWKARQDKAEATLDKAERLQENFAVGAQAGEVAGESAQARTVPTQPAADALSDFLT